jgi:translation initiation factor 6
MSMLRTNFSGDTNLGLYGFATDSYCLLGVPSKKVRQALEVPVHHVTILNTNFAGLFIAGNSQGIVIPEIVAEDHLASLQRYFKKILVIKSNYSAMGNLLLMNDNGIIISPLLKKHKKEISAFFGLHSAVTMIGKQRTVGTLGIATNKGCLLHPKARKAEIKIISDILGVECNVGTVNFGSPYPGAGVVANSKGFVASESTSGPELGRITEALGFLDK